MAGESPPVLVLYCGRYSTPVVCYSDFPGIAADQQFLLDTTALLRPFLPSFSLTPPLPPVCCCDSDSTTLCLVPRDS